MRNTTRVRGIRGKDSLCAALAIIMRGENVKNCALLRWAKPALARSRTTEKLSLESWLSAELETKPSPFDLFRANSSEFNRGASRICRTNKLIKLQFIDHAKFDAHRFESTAIGNPKKKLSRLLNNQSTSFISYHSRSSMWRSRRQPRHTNSQIN